MCDKKTSKIGRLSCLKNTRKGNPWGDEEDVWRWESLSLSSLGYGYRNPITLLNSKLFYHYYHWTPIVFCIMTILLLLSCQFVLMTMMVSAEGHALLFFIQLNYHHLFIFIVILVVILYPNSIGTMIATLQTPPTIVTLVVKQKRRQHHRLFFFWEVFFQSAHFNESFILPAPSTNTTIFKQTTTWRYRSNVVKHYGNKHLWWIRVAWGQWTFFTFPKLVVGMRYHNNCWL